MHSYSFCSKKYILKSYVVFFNFIYPFLSIHSINFNIALIHLKNTSLKIMIKRSNITCLISYVVVAQCYHISPLDPSFSYFPFCFVLFQQTLIPNKNIFIKFRQKH